ncbi:hypothetical protein AWZ03_013943 [Drosophila navojoa]|uniref:Uncharacterized protein n=1 Tax=Drosophila navojoa TaxID=7232 RepID=A0A484AT94_DRONA|nr:hypothetical protein AWZ03_013943 [Drosophila navojoa]
MMRKRAPQSRPQCDQSPIRNKRPPQQPWPINWVKESQFQSQFQFQFTFPFPFPFPFPFQFQFQFQSFSHIKMHNVSLFMALGRRRR